MKNGKDGRHVLGKIEGGKYGAGRAARGEIFFAKGGEICKNFCARQIFFGGGSAGAEGREGDSRSRPPTLL